MRDVIGGCDRAIARSARSRMEAPFFPRIRVWCNVCMRRAGLMRRRFVFASLVFSLCASSSARAAESECNPAYEQADMLLHASQSPRLTEARERLRVCSARECKGWMVKDCVKWLDEVERRLPSVVLGAKDAQGAELADVEVAADAKKIASRLDGRAVEIDPGEHTFVFTFAEGRSVTQKTVVKEGEKAQRVSVVLPQKPATPPAAVKPAPPVATEPTRLDLRTLGLVAGGAGAAGLIVGGFFGVKAMNAKSNANCNDGSCDPGPLSDARSAATVSTIGFVAGGVLLAGGAVLFLFDLKQRGDKRVGGAW
jgi:hypothetical protein